jgi:hypothetical protein
MLQIGGGLDFGEEAFRADNGGELGAEDFDCDLPVVPQVLGQVHCGHPSRAELPLNAVSVGEGAGEGF